MTPSSPRAPARAAKRGYQYPRRLHSKPPSSASTPLLRDKGPHQRLELSAAQVDEAPARHVQEGQVLHPGVFSFTRGSETCSLPVGKYLSIVRLRSGKCLIA